MKSFIRVFPAVRARAAWIAVLTSGLVVVGRAEVDIPPGLQQALENTSREDNQWAYTETTVVRPKSSKDKEAVLTVVRVDPSKPYDEHFTPVLIEGHKPTTAQLKEYRKKGEKRAANLQKKAPSGRGAPAGSAPADLKAMIDVDQIKITAETESSITYHVPLRKGAKVEGVELSKVDLSIRITKQKPTIEHMEMHLRDNVRVMMVANVKSADFAVDFSKVDPKYPPVMTRVKGAAKVKLFLVAGVSPVIDLARSEFVRVEPFDRRFEVKIGPLKVFEK